MCVVCVPHSSSFINSVGGSVSASLCPQPGYAATAFISVLISYDTRGCGAGNLGLAPLSVWLVQGCLRCVFGVPHALLLLLFSVCRTIQITSTDVLS